MIHSPTMRAVLAEVRAAGCATSYDVAQEVGLTVKRASTYLARLAECGLIERRHILRDGREGRPAYLWGPR